MRGAIRLFKIAGISINIHITFVLLFFLLFMFLDSGWRWAFLISSIFVFVTLHELSHSLVAKKFGIQVKEITLLPIGGVASMSRMPEKPHQEFLISLAGPMLNVAVVIIFFFPLYWVLGKEVLFHPLSIRTFPLMVAHVYWINLILAGFNLIPAFPMDGGRILRAVLARKMGFKRATRIAVNFGHIFALLFGYIGLTNGHLVLIIIAVFIYMAASSEEVQVDVKVTLKKFSVKDVLPSQFLTLEKEATLRKVLELIFHSHQEDFPVIENNKMVGFVSRQDIINGIHKHGTGYSVQGVMRNDIPSLKEQDSLDTAQNVMQEHGIKALPVMREERVIGVITIEDISRVYSVMTERR